MPDWLYVLLSGILNFGVLFGVCLRELVLLKRIRGNDGRDRFEAPGPTPPLPSAPQKPLPECLVPRPLAHGPAPERPARVRELEPA